MPENSVNRKNAADQNKTPVFGETTRYWNFINMPENSVKQVIVIRRDLKMRRGKEIAQGSHASMAFMTNRIRKNAADQNKTPVFGETSSVYKGFSHAEVVWIEGSFAKVVCQVNSEEELLGVFNKAKEAGLEVHLITDSGRTEFHGEPTNTAIAIGPDFSDKIDPVTGELSLY